eukprot:1037298-Rhodomonas_salina.1
MLHVSGSASAQAHSMASERREVASVADTPTKIKTTGKERSDSGTAQAGGPGTINATTPCHTVAREGTRRTSLAVTRSGDEQDLAPPSDSDPTLNQGPARAYGGRRGRGAHWQPGCSESRSESTQRARVEPRRASG